HPADRGEGAAEAPASEPEPEAQGLSGLNVHQAEDETRGWQIASPSFLTPGRGEEVVGWELGDGAEPRRREVDVPLEHDLGHGALCVIFDADTGADGRRAGLLEVAERLALEAVELSLGDERAARRPREASAGR